LFKAARMKKAEVLVLEKDVERVTRALGDLGVVELAEVRADPEAGIVMLGRGAELAECRRRLERASELRNMLGLSLSQEVREDVARVPVERIDPLLDTVEEEVKNLQETKTDRENEKDRIRELISHMQTFEVLRTPVERLNEFSFLHFAVGSMPQENLMTLAGRPPKNALILPYVTSDGRQKVVAISDKKRRFSLETVLSEHGFRGDGVSPELQGLPTEIIKQCRLRLLRIDAELAENNAAYEDLRRSYGAVLVELERSLQIQVKLLEAAAHFGRTWATCLITGWMPARRSAEVKTAVERAAEGRAVVELKDPDEVGEVPPVLYENPRFLRPFELLVGTYSRPAYDEIEPTFFAAVSFLLMFGAMFGDVGQGAVLALIGFVVVRKAKGSTARSLGAIVGYAGAAAIVFGFLYGSFFGLEGIIPPLWGSPFDLTSKLMVAGVAMGVGLISVGLVTNMINRARAGDYGEALFSRTGLAGGLFYWGVLGLAVRMFVLSPRGGEPLSGASKAMFAMLIGLPLVLVMLRTPVARLLSRRKGAGGDGVLMGVFEGFMEIVETVIGFLANTLSFLRIAALALSHFGLCYAVFLIIEMVRNRPWGLVGSVLVFVFGNLLVIGLEGLVASIQAMRLEYYEFFSRFLQGGGKAFEPFRIDSSFRSVEESSE